MNEVINNNNIIVEGGGGGTVISNTSGGGGGGLNLLIYLIPIKLAITIYLFSKAKLPIGLSRYIGRVYHFFTQPVRLGLQYAGLTGPLISKLDDNVYLGAMPMRWHVSLLSSKYQIKAVINLCDEYEGPIQSYSQLNIQQLYVPVVDHYEPDVNIIVESIQFIIRQISMGNRVYIHCKAGRGRSGAIAICWIAYSQKVSLEQAQKILIEKRKIVRKHLYKQKNVLQYYSNYCLNNNSHSHHGSHNHHHHHHNHDNENSVTL